MSVPSAKVEQFLREQRPATPFVVIDLDLVEERYHQLAEAIPGAVMVSTDGFGLLSDTVHYDTSGQLKLGRAMAEAARKIQGNGNH